MSNTLGDPTRETAPSLVVLPTYNERENLEPVVRAVLRQASDLEVLIVDDNSPDGTGAIADHLASQPDLAGRLHVMHRAAKLGLGTAYIQAFDWALKRGYAYIYEMDADFSHDPADLIRLRSAVSSGRAEVAIGSRWVPGGGAPNWPLLRRLISRGGSMYARWLLSLPGNDLTSGFKCFSRSALEALDFEAIHSNGYAFQVEVNYRCHRLGFELAEVPIMFVDRRVGQSKMGTHIVLEAALVVLRLRTQSPPLAVEPPAAPAGYSRTP